MRLSDIVQGKKKRGRDNEERDCLFCLDKTMGGSCWALVSQDDYTVYGSDGSGAADSPQPRPRSSKSARVGVEGESLCRMGRYTGAGWVGRPCTTATPAKSAEAFLSMEEARSSSPRGSSFVILR
jgi:hypothetical protein